MQSILPEIANYLQKEITNPDEFKDNELEQDYPYYVLFEQKMNAANSLQSVKSED